MQHQRSMCTFEYIFAITTYNFETRTKENANCNSKHFCYMVCKLHPNLIKVALAKKEQKIYLFLKNIKVCNQERFEMTYAGRRCGAGRGCGDLTRPPVHPAPARSPGWRVASSGTHQYALIKSNQISFEKHFFLFMRRIRMWMVVRSTGTASTVYTSTKIL